MTKGGEKYTRAEVARIRRKRETLVALEMSRIWVATGCGFPMTSRRMSMGKAQRHKKAGQSSEVLKHTQHPKNACREHIAQKSTV